MFTTQNNQIIDEQDGTIIATVHTDNHEDAPCIVHMMNHHEDLRLALGWLLDCQDNGNVPENVWQNAREAYKRALRIE